ncbi:MAG: complex I NDUFA9 subunit family protein [Nitrospirae bacterium]|nr:MAG: complex I NDUFA9 subunit family protein [Nitrospirota bacterium]
MIFIAGASGFIGGHLVDHLLRRGEKIRALVRSAGADERFTRSGIQTVVGDITQPETLKGVLSPDDLVIHLVGIIEEKGPATFQQVHVRGTTNLVAEAKQAGVRHFFYQSALGADLNSWSGYLRTKAEAEEAVKAGGLSHTIFRPSLIIGPWDGFTKKILDMLKISPVLPVPGDGKARFQPVYVKDWLRCIQAVIESPGAYRGTFDIGGPEHLTYQEIVEMLAQVSGHTRMSVNIPMGLMRFAARAAGLLPTPPVTLDQLRLLEQDNITAPDAVRRSFGFDPLPLRDALKEFLA